MSKRLYYETTEVITRKKKGWIEVDTDFTQVYDCFKEISKNINSPTSWKLLFWLLSEEANKQNGFRTGKATYQRFNAYLSKDCKKCGISNATFYNSINELEKCKAITQFGRGFYYFSPYIFWKDEKTKRDEFIHLEAKENKFLSYNPVDTEEIDYEDSK